MKINFEYSREKDIWCLLSYGNSSFNSKEPTKIYKKILDEYKEDISEEKVNDFINKYFFENKIIIQEYIDSYQEEWDIISNFYKTRTENIFNVELKENITVFLTLNSRCPYNISENFLFVTIPAYSMRKTVMHELWHFYTWQKFGVEWQEKLGFQKYNDIKEALTVLLNLEFKDLLGDVVDNGYLQHKELREKIVDFWNKDKSIDNLWNFLINL